MANLAMLCPMSKTLQEAAKSQDLIGWDEFFHGKVSIKIRKIQEAHCIIAALGLMELTGWHNLSANLWKFHTPNGCIGILPFTTMQKGTYDCERSRMLEKRWISLQTQGHQIFPPNAAIYWSYHRYPQRLHQQSMTHTGSWHLKRQKQLLPGTKESMHKRAPECNVENPKPPRTF
jgi:hypothetical protein